jgi:ubiquitin carboxyl-terminal hydrolase 10
VLFMFTHTVLILPLWYVERMMDEAMCGALVERRIRGMQNPGNLCFVNSVLQCLAACAPLFLFLVGLQQSSIPSKMQTLAELISLMNEFKEEELELGSDQKTVAQRKASIKSSMLSRVVNEWVPEDPVRPTGGKARQEDAQEFLSYLLNALHDELSPHAEQTETQTPASSHDAAEEIPENDEDGWLQVGGKGGAKKTAVRKVCAAAIGSLP